MMFSARLVSQRCAPTVRLPKRTPGPVRVVAAIPEGTTVRVNTSIKVYHVPKTSGEAVELEGKQGVVTADVSEYKGHPTSATLPLRVTFSEPTKFIAHLEEEELDVVE
mmetsp:Transcript_3714/g.10734  ORF Transcript_3714/g.10734 Transcript_3714/m.10734 type:complete len:108 (+) Transcript_3714:104-427(+)|eukprot:CAMPEP_0117674516 /NCGR_PEP_ID=MMETSP0804-20121206/15086_1 /TAXON_ID=1074897 /ORGANISM="Tetraselmis astigmatica, Strain CCMP880" /LENGTH=107 /DNA_ID=CAMNT_0005483403 /DNA_START=74 /DNA_END=397 /DNA_ORIENTATION=+